MLYGLLFPLGLLVLAFCTMASAQQQASAWPPIQTLTSQNGTQYGIVTNSDTTVIKTPKPTLIILTGAYADTLGCNATGTPDPCYYSNACEFLLPSGWMCASLDLPSHGSQLQTGEPVGIAGWRWRLDRHQDIVNQNNERVHDMLDDLITRGLTDSSHVAISGISRGGLLAAHYMISEARVHAAGLMSPVTNLTLLEEFDGYVGNLANKLALSTPQNAAQLANKNVWAIIGDQDVRVYTDSLIETMRHIQCTGLGGGGLTARFHIPTEPAGCPFAPTRIGGRSEVNRVSRKCHIGLLRRGPSLSRKM